AVEARREAQLHLDAAVDLRRGVLGVAAVPGIGSVDSDVRVADEAEERADRIHGPEDSNRPRRHEGNGAEDVNDPGDDLFSQGVAPRVSSALESLTSVFGMGTGGTSPL